MRSIHAIIRRRWCLRRRFSGRRSCRHWGMNRFGCKGKKLQKHIAVEMHSSWDAKKGSRGGTPLWGVGQRPNCFSGAQLQGSPQQRCRQRSVPASNFAHPQMRPQAALPQDSVKNRKNPHEKNRHVPTFDADVPVLVLGIVCPSDTTCYFASLSGGGASRHPPLPALPPVRC